MTSSTRQAPPWAITIHPDSKKPDKVACSLRHGEVKMTVLVKDRDAALDFARASMPTVEAAAAGTLEGAGAAGDEDAGEADTDAETPAASEAAPDTVTGNPDPFELPSFLDRRGGAAQ